MHNVFNGIRVVLQEVFLFSVVVVWFVVDNGSFASKLIIERLVGGIIR